CLSCVAPCEPRRVVRRRVRGPPPHDCACQATASSVGLRDSVVRRGPQQVRQEQSHGLGAPACHAYYDQSHSRFLGNAMTRDEGLPPPRIDWTAQRAFLGRAVFVWQVNLAALLAVLFVAFVGFSFSGPFLPLLVRHLGVTEPGAVARWSGLLMGLGPLSAVLTSPLWGRLADRIGGRPLLLRTVFGFAALNALSAMATDVWQLAGLRLLMGALGGFTAVALTLASLSAPPEQTTRAIALVQSAQILGQMIGPVFRGPMADHWGIRAAFWGSSALAVVAGGDKRLVVQGEARASRQRAPRP